MMKERLERDENGNNYCLNYNYKNKIYKKSGN